METPSKDAGVREWRQYAGFLRGRLGEVNRQASALAEEMVRPLREEMRAKARASDSVIARLSARELTARTRAEQLTRNRSGLLVQKARDAALFDRLEELLLEGDVPAAIDELMVRRAAIDAARARREAQR